jgi:hypothetical protein
VGDKRYLIWATTTVGDKQVSVSATEQEWQGLEPSLKTVLGGEKVKEVKTQVNMTLADGKLVVTENARSNKQIPLATVEQKSTTVAFETFQKIARFTDSHTPPSMSSSSASKPVGTSGGSGSQGTTTASKKSSTTGSTPKPLLSNEAIAVGEAARDLRSVNNGIASTTLLIGLQHIQDQLGKDKAPVQILAPNDNSGLANPPKTTWEITLSKHMLDRGVTENQLLRICEIPALITKPLYIPIRTDKFHYVGLMVDEQRRLHYYDSFGRSYDSNPTLKTEIDAFCQKNKLTFNQKHHQYVNDQPHQQDHIHCGLYQMRWYQHLCKRASSISLNPPTPYGYQTTENEMLELRRMLDLELSHSVVQPPVSGAAPKLLVQPPKATTPKSAASASAAAPSATTASTEAVTATKLPTSTLSATTAAAAVPATPSLATAATAVPAAVAKASEKNLYLAPWGERRLPRIERIPEQTPEELRLIKNRNEFKQLYDLLDIQKGLGAAFLDPQLLDAFRQVAKKLGVEGISDLNKEISDPHFRQLQLKSVAEFLSYSPEQLRVLKDGHEFRRIYHELRDQKKSGTPLEFDLLTAFLRADYALGIEKMSELERNGLISSYHLDSALIIEFKREARERLKAGEGLEVLSAEHQPPASGAAATPQAQPPKAAEPAAVVFDAEVDTDKLSSRYNVDRIRQSSVGDSVPPMPQTL